MEQQKTTERNADFSIWNYLYRKPAAAMGFMVWYFGIIRTYWANKATNIYALDPTIYEGL